MVNNTPTKRLSSPIEIGLLLLSVGVLIFIAVSAVRMASIYITVHYGITGEATLIGTLGLVFTMEYMHWRRMEPHRPKRVEL
jgi:hypothetical protein